MKFISSSDFKHTENGPLKAEATPQYNEKWGFWWEEKQKLLELMQ